MQGGQQRQQMEGTLAVGLAGLIQHLATLRSQYGLLKAETEQLPVMAAAFVAEAAEQVARRQAGQAVHDPSRGEDWQEVLYEENKLLHAENTWLKEQIAEKTLKENVPKAEGAWESALEEVIHNAILQLSGFADWMMRVKEEQVLGCGCVCNA